MLITKGMWSEMGFARGCTLVEGKDSPHEEDTSTQSSLTRRGFNCMLLQVNLLPLKGMSTRSKSIIALLNNYISVILPFGLFLSSAHLQRLKSPARSQSSKDVVSKLRSQVMKAILPEE